LGADLDGEIGTHDFNRTIEIVAGVAKSAFADWDFLTREGFVFHHEQRLLYENAPRW
jgi:hypothetical protein